MNKKLLIALVGIASGLLLITLVITVIVALQNNTDTEQTNANKVADVIDDTTNTNITKETDDSTNSDPVSTHTNSNQGVSTTTTGAGQTNQAKITTLSKNFTERYGSFSTDTNHENIEALRTFMTDDMNEVADALIRKNLEKPATTFYGVSTQAITVKIVDFSEDSTGATVQVSVRRSETKGDNDPEVKSGKAKLQLKQFDGVWKVDTFQWL